MSVSQTLKNQSLICIVINNIRKKKQMSECLHLNYISLWLFEIYKKPQLIVLLISPISIGWRKVNNDMMGRDSEHCSFSLIYHWKRLATWKLSTLITNNTISVLRILTSMFIHFRKQSSKCFLWNIFTPQDKCHFMCNVHQCFS